VSAKALGFVRFGASVPRELFSWMVGETEKRSMAQGRRVIYGELVTEGLRLLQERVKWQAGAQERDARERRALAERAANAEEKSFQCEGCHKSPGIEFLDSRWLCEDCKRDGAAGLSREASV
jgi:hypothetical protein